MKTVWILDADGVDFSDEKLENVYKNRRVKNFLDEEKKLGVSAARGIGKTFLLKTKRYLYQSKSGSICLPFDSMVDVINTPNINASLYKFFENYDNWVKLWKISIIMSVIKALIKRKYISDNVFDSLPIELNELYISEYYRTSEILCFILAQERKYVNELFSNVFCLVNLLDKISFGIYVFLDKIDQALASEIHSIIGQTKMSTGPRNASFWQFAQLSLAQTSYEILAINPHLKVYYSIRKEALVDAEQVVYTYENIREYIANIEYSYDDLEKMYGQYISFENDENLIYPELKNENPSKAFIGIESLKHSYVKDYEEPIFKYIFRHTFMRPRDIMDICYNLFLSDLSKVGNPQGIIRQVVNRESMIILETYFSEVERFIFGLKREQLNKLCQLINFNAMDETYIKYVCRRLNEELDKDENEQICCNNNCNECEGVHPFCQLYNAGLLGVMWSNHVVEYSIRFINTNESKIENNNHILPKAELYFLHPCLSNKVEYIRKVNHKEFDVVKSTPIGNMIEINQKVLQDIKFVVAGRYNEVCDERIFLSSTCHDLSDIRKQISNILTSSGRDVVMSDSDNFNSNLHGVNSHDHCIDELLKCKSVIFIVGGRYGGEYNGDRYRDLAKEIGNIDPILKNPSISLVEYYVAKCNGLPIQVFIDRKIFDERLPYKNNLNYIPVYAKDNRVFHIIDFVTKQHKENWFRVYNDIVHLQELIKIVYK